MLVRIVEARVWGEPEVLPGELAMFSGAAAGGRVDLVTQDGPTIYRHLDGDPDRRAALVADEGALLLRAADVDGDGRYDLAVAGEEKVFVWLRGEDGPRRVKLLEAPVAIVAVDFPDVDGDDRPDFVALAASGNLFVRCTQAAAPPRPETMP